MNMEPTPPAAPSDVAHELDARASRTGRWFLGLAVALLAVTIALAYAINAKGEADDSKNVAEAAYEAAAQSAAEAQVAYEAQRAQFEFCTEAGNADKPVCATPVEPADPVPGAPGQPGETGATGATGPAGLSCVEQYGLTACRGAPGKPGKDGKNGGPGAPGASGGPGVPGADGKDGRDGKDGATGPKGDTGDPGPKGDKGDPGLVTVIDDCSPPPGEIVVDVNTSYDAASATFTLSCTSAPFLSFLP